MLVDIYRGGVNPRQFVAVPTGRPLPTAHLPNTADLAELHLYLQGTDIASSGEFSGVDVQAVLKQVVDDGFALFQTSP
ncbi:hypothetical protein [Dyella sp. 2HG41-7]|uniref:hypothetical protein n=1 Tax=Dyella sp. 2HG41-7 TaxID=2883239 RepID=UPI001F35E02C|nr:hypothetical protein [Dyella sp. 2HG41-7]